MLTMLRQRLEKDEEGFTLIELMVVVLIIAILIAIAIPTFLGARSRAQNRAAQSNLRNALTAEKTFYTDNQTYTADDNTGALHSIEPALTYSASVVPNGTSAVPGTVYTEAVQSAAGDWSTCVTAKSASGNYYGIRDQATGTGAGTTYFSGSAAPASGCAAATYPDPSFK